MSGTAAQLSSFTSDSGRDRFLRAYEKTFAQLWPGAARAEDVPTAAGTVRVYRHGPAGEDPVVLLSGAGGNALSWYSYVAPLGRHRPVLCVDPLGEAGRSVQTAPLPDAAAAAAWLDDVLAAAGARQAHLVGTSFGGWLALAHAVHRPGRVGAVTLVDPAGFAVIGSRFYRWVVLGGLGSLLPAGLRRRAARWLRNGTLEETELLRLGLAARSFRRRLPVPPVWTDEELTRIRTPVQVLLGEHSALHDSAAVAARVAGTVPSWRTEIVPGTGHALSIEAVDLVVERVLAFRPTRTERKESPC